MLNEDLQRDKTKVGCYMRSMSSEYWHAGGDTNFRCRCRCQPLYCKLQQRFGRDSDTRRVTAMLDEDQQRDVTTGGLGIRDRCHHLE